MPAVKLSLSWLWLVPLLPGMTVCALAQIEADAQCEPNALINLATEKYDTSIWFSLDRYRDLESVCGSGPNSDRYRYALMQLESFIGNHATALSYMDEYLGLSPNSSREFQSSVTSVPAVAHIVERARDHSIVMINERHHASSDRLLTMELLEPLAEQGYRYLAIEAGWNGDQVNIRGYPNSLTGYYVNDVVFAELVRSAIKFGYQVIAYEQEDVQRNSEDTSEMNPQERREWWQATNMMTRVFDIDRDAKVLFHLGYAHLHESRTDYWVPMAHFLREFTGLDPLTVEQTDFSERSRPELEHPLRIRARELGLLGKEMMVLVDADGEPIRSRANTDLAVFGISTKYENGRPTWMSMGGRRQPIGFDTPECAKRNCIVEARRAGFPDEVPFDRVEVVSAERTTLYLPPGEDMVVDVMGLNRSTLGTRNLRIPAP